MDLTLSILSYDRQEIEFARCRDVYELLGQVRTDRVNWISVNNLTLERDHAAVRALLEFFQLNPRLLDSIFGHAPQSLDDEEDTCLYMDYAILLYRPERRAHAKVMGSFILTRSVLIQFERIPSGLFDRLSKRILGKHTNAPAYQADYLLYLIFKTIVLHYQDILKQLGEKFELLEDDVIGHPGREVVYDRILDLREEFKPLYTALVGLAEIVDRLREEESHHLDREVKKRLGKELHRETMELLAGYQNLRTWVAELIEIHRANVNESTNRVMKILTIISTIFLPLSFIAGIYGMNFAYMPELEWQLGYPAVLLSMLLLAAGALIYMRRKNWL